MLFQKSIELQQQVTYRQNLGRIILLLTKIYHDEGELLAQNPLYLYEKKDDIDSKKDMVYQYFLATGLMYGNDWFDTTNVLYRAKSKKNNIYGDVNITCQPKSSLVNKLRLLILDYKNNGI